MNEDNRRKLWVLIQEAGDYLQGQLPEHPNHPKGRNPYAHVALAVKNNFNTNRVAVVLPSDACYTRLIEIPEEVDEKNSISFLENPNSGIQIPVSYTHLTLPTTSPV